jgi:hypothetical protein
MAAAHFAGPIACASIQGEVVAFRAIALDTLRMSALRAGAHLLHEATAKGQPT